MPSAQRVAACFTLTVRPEFIEEYKKRHAAVWPDMLRAIRDAGWANYTIFMRDDGTVVGYMETDDLELAMQRMNQSDVNSSWAAVTSHLFEEPQQWLEAVFNLDDQLRAAGLSSTIQLPKDR